MRILKECSVASLVVLLSACFLAFVPDVYSAEMSATLGSNTEYSNNLLHTHVDPEKIEEFSETLNLDLLLEEQRKKYTLSINGNFQHERFLNHSFADQSEFTTGVGLVNFEIVESFLDWKSSYKRTQVLKDEDLPDVPNNKEVRDIYKTGPQISYLINSLTNMTIDAIYTQTEISDPDVYDTRRVDGSLALNRRMDSVTSVGFTLNRVVMLDADGGDEYERWNWSASVKRDIVRGKISASAGRGRFKSETEETTGTQFYDFSIEKEWLSHSFSAAYKKDVTDTSIGIDYVDDGEVLPGAGLSANDVYKEESYRISASREFEETKYRIDAYHIERDYLGGDGDENRSGYTLKVDHQVIAGFGLDLSWNRVISRNPQRSYEGKNERDIYRLSGDYTFSKELSVDSYLQYLEKYNKRFKDKDSEEFVLGINIKWNIM